MNSTFIVTIVGAIIGSTALSSLIIFLIQRKDNKQHELKVIIDKLNRLEHDSARTQLLLLIHDMPENTTEVLTVAEYYFKELKGDWYMSMVFEEWLGNKGIQFPSWYKR